MVLFDGYGPCIVALDIILSFLGGLHVVFTVPYFRFRSVLPKLLVSSGRIVVAVC
jgi:hypothetical protein